MPDLATLGIAIDNSQIGPANTGLAALTATGVGTEAQMKRVAQASAVQAAQLRNLNTALAQQKTAQAATKDVLTEVDPLMKKLSDGTSSWTIGMQKLAGQQKAVAEGAEASVHGLGGLERVLSGVVAETAGANERLVSFTARFAQLGIGGPIMIAVLAGLAGVAFAISNLTEDYRKAGEAYDKYMDSLRQTSPLAIVGHQLDAMHDKLGLLLTIQSFVPGANLVPGLSDKLKETIQEIHDLDVQYKNLLDNQAKMAQFTGETTELGRAFSDLQRKFTGGQLDQQGIQELVGIENRIKAEISGLNADPNALGSTKDTHAEIDRLKGLLDQADQLLQAQTKVAGLYTKMSGAPIQQVETVLEAAAHNIPAILQGIQALSNGVKILDNSDFPGFTSEPFDPNRTPSILLGAGQREHLDPEKQAAEQHANQVKAVQDAQRLTLEIQNSVAAGLDLVGVFGDVSDQTADIIKGLASGVGAANELAKAIKSGSSGDILTAGIGVAGAIGSVLSGLLGGHQLSPEEQAALDAQKANTIALQRLTDVESLKSDVTGTQAQEIRSLINRGLTGSGTIGAGLTDAQKAELTDFGKQFGLDSKSSTFLQQLLDALNKTDLLQINGSLGSRLQNQQTGFQLKNITDPIQQLLAELQTLKPHQGPLGDPANLIPSGNALIFNALNGLNLGSATGRQSGEDALSALFDKLNSGQITTAQLGGLTPQEFENELLQMTGQLRDADSALAGVVDSLKDFRKSLLLDSSLTTLSPVQQLAEARQQYLDDLAKAKAGDQAAAAALPDLARQFLSLDKAVNASGPQFAQDFASVLAESGALADMFSGQVDVATQQLEVMKPIKDNTAATVTAMKDSVTVQQAGFKMLVDQVAALTASQTDGFEKLSRNARWTKGN